MSPLAKGRARPAAAPLVGVAVLARAVVVLLLVALLGAACRREAPPLTIHAAASLTDVLPRVADRWLSQPGRSGSSAASTMPPRFHFGASSRLAKQIERGAPGDAFVSADESWMDYLTERGLVVSETRRVLLENELVVVVPRESTLVLEDARALAGSRGVRRLALAGEGVPAGRYARAALEQAGVLEAVRDHIASADNVRTTLAWVARGEADAGVVYRSDAEAEPRVKVAFSFAAGAHPPIVYPAAVLTHATHARAAESFLDYCGSDEARALFVAAGFTLPNGRTR